MSCWEMKMKDLLPKHSPSFLTPGQKHLPESETFDMENFSWNVENGKKSSLIQVNIMIF